MTEQEEIDLREWATVHRKGGMFHARLVLSLLDELALLRKQIAAQNVEALANAKADEKEVETPPPPPGYETPLE